MQSSFNSIFTPPSQSISLKPKLAFQNTTPTFTGKPVPYDFFQGAPQRMNYSNQLTEPAKRADVRLPQDISVNTSDTSVQKRQPHFGMFKRMSKVLSRNKGEGSGGSKKGNNSSENKEQEVEAFRRSTDTLAYATDGPSGHKLKPFPQDSPVPEANYETEDGWRYANTPLGFVRKIPGLNDNRRRLRKAVLPPQGQRDRALLSYEQQQQTPETIPLPYHAEQPIHQEASNFLSGIQGLSSSEKVHKYNELALKDAVLGQLPILPGLASKLDWDTKIRLNEARERNMAKKDLLQHHIEKQHGAVDTMRAPTQSMTKASAAMENKRQSLTASFIDALEPAIKEASAEAEGQDYLRRHNNLDFADVAITALRQR